MCIVCVCVCGSGGVVMVCCDSDGGKAQQNMMLFYVQLTELSLRHSCVDSGWCLGSLSSWTWNLLPSLRSLSLWTRFSLRISLYFALFSISSTLTSLPAPAAAAATTALHCWNGIGHVMSGAWFPPDMALRIEAKQFNICFITPENLVSRSLSVLGAFFISFFLNSKWLSCVFHCGEASLWPLCHESQIAGVLK